jgi:hypothetical protein
MSAADHAAVMDDQSGDRNVAVRWCQGGLLDRLADPAFIVYPAFLVHVAVIIPYRRRRSLLSGFFCVLNSEQQARSPLSNDLLQPTKTSNHRLRRSAGDLRAADSSRSCDR